MSSNMTIFSLLLVALPYFSLGSEVNIEMPSYAIRKSSLQIKCFYGVDPKLVSMLIWYKDGNQFFQYKPNDTPSNLHPQLAYFDFDVQSFEKGEFYLRNLTLDASGRYKCQVHSGTNSQPKSAEANLVVIDLPLEAADITGTKNSYADGETVEANCSTLLKQPTRIAVQWKINQLIIKNIENSSQLIQYSTNETGNGSRNYIEGIRFTPKKSDFISGMIKLECQVTIGNVFQKSTVVSIKEQNYRSPLPLTSALRVRRDLDVKVEIPEYKELGSNAELKCLYSLHGAKLYSVKWYKETKQFYQFIPANSEPKSSHSQPHLQVDISSSNEGRVFLQNLSMEATGKYKCEVITEAPTFLTKFGEGNMTVIDLPESAPVFTGLKPNYQIGEMVHVNCSSLFSKPAAVLQWQINDNILDDANNWLIKYPITYDHKGLETAVLGIQFIALSRHFSDGTMRLKCKAQIGNLYYQSQENVVLHSHYKNQKMKQENVYSAIMNSLFANSSPRQNYVSNAVGLLLILFHCLLYIS